MAAVYRQLTEEGVLGSIRGSRTLLLGRSTGRELKVRGVVGMPVSIFRFQALADYRAAVICLRDQLRRGGFVIQTIFFEEPEEGTETIIARLKKERVDTVLWLLPGAGDRETGPRLRDLGIQFVGINIAPLSGLPARYQVHRQRAIRAILRQWRDESGLTGATVIRTTRDTSLDTERLKNLRALVQGEGLDCEIATVRDGHISTLLQSLCKNCGKGIILPAPAATMLGSRAPDTIAAVLTMCRVALIDGPMESLFPVVLPSAAVDIVTVNWPAVAAEIVQDLVTGDALDENQARIFEAKEKLRFSLRQSGAPGNRRGRALHPMPAGSHV